MTYMEKVIKALEFCLKPLTDEEKQNYNCTHDECPYFREYPGGMCLSAVCSDALALLKSQQPRVLTLEEVKASKGKDLMLEYKPWGCEDSIVTAVTIEGCGTKGVSFVMSVACDYAAYNHKHSLGWRCWNVRPTDAERMKVAWE